MTPRQIALFSVATALSLQAPCAWAEGAPAGDPYQATVTKIVRHVDWQRARTSHWQPAPVDTLLMVGDALRTGERARAELLYGDGSVTRIGALTTMTLIGDNRRELRLDAGRIWLHVRKHSAGMRIITPGAVAAVTGTELMVEVDPVKKSTDVTVFEGSVNVTSDVGNLVRVIGGTTTTVPFRAPASAPAPLPPAKVQERENIFHPLAVPAAAASSAPQTGTTKGGTPTAQASSGPTAQASNAPTSGTPEVGPSAPVTTPATPAVQASANPQVANPTTANEPKPVQPDLKGQTNNLLDPRLINGSPTQGQLKVIIK